MKHGKRLWVGQACTDILLGRAVAKRYAEEGARVMVADINEVEAMAVAAEIGRGAIGVSVNVTKQDSIDAMVQTVVAQAGRIDILVNNAGVFEMAPILEITRESYAKQFAVNLEGLLFTLQAVARRMVAQGTEARSSTSLPRLGAEARLWSLSIVRPRPR